MSLAVLICDRDIPVDFLSPQAARVTGCGETVISRMAAGIAAVPPSIFLASLTALRQTQLPFAGKTPGSALIAPLRCFLPGGGRSMFAYLLISYKLSGRERARVERNNKINIFDVHRAYASPATTWSITMGRPAQIEPARRAASLQEAATLIDCVPPQMRARHSVQLWRNRVHEAIHGPAAGLAPAILLRGVG